MTKTTPLRKARLKSGLSINKLARQANLDPGQVSRIERGLRAPSLDTAAKLIEQLPSLTLADLRMP